MWILLLLAFDPAATAATLGGGGDRRTVLAAYEDLPRGELEAAQAAGHGGLVARIVADPAAPVAERILAARALARLGDDSAWATLAATLHEPATPEAVALAREATQALVRAKAYSHLGPALAVADPEVRAMAAAWSPEHARLCALLTDPWPRVRAAAARGLGRARGEAAACLAGALADPSPAVQAAAAQAAGATGLASLGTPLRRLAGDPQAERSARAAALAALGELGDLVPALAVLEAHQRDGSVEALALGAVQALELANRPEARDRLASVAADAPSPAVRLAAARALLNHYRAGPEAAERLRARMADTPGLRSLMPEPTPEADPAEVDPE